MHSKVVVLQLTDTQAGTCRNCGALTYTNTHTHTFEST